MAVAGVRQGGQAGSLDGVYKAAAAVVWQYFVIKVTRAFFWPLAVCAATTWQWWDGPAYVASGLIAAAEDGDDRQLSLECYRSEILQEGG